LYCFQTFGASGVEFMFCALVARQASNLLFVALLVHNT
jgi:hypothetical protein